jgi:ferrochelatase
LAEFNLPVKIQLTTSPHHQPPPKKIAVLLANTGTPDSPEPADVRRYLKEFLGDRRVIDYPRWLWLPLLHLVILNVRPRRSGRLYQQIWDREGFPLLQILDQQTTKLQESLQEQISGDLMVTFGMRYGNPSITHVLNDLQSLAVTHLLVLPLFPQYSHTTSGSVMDAVHDALSDWQQLPELRWIHDYHNHPAYIQALSDSIRDFQEKHGVPDRLLLSYHGLPSRYIKNGDPYQQQCRETTRLLEKELNLSRNTSQMAYQSQFGPESWLEPSTEEMVESFAKQGNSVQVVAPGFSADCLETLYELDMEYRQVYEQAGGQKYRYIPALNSSSAHIEALEAIIKEHLTDWLDA